MDSCNNWRTRNAAVLSSVVIIVSKSNTFKTCINASHSLRSSSSSGGEYGSYVLLVSVIVLIISKISLLFFIYSE